MDLRDLEILVALAEHRHFARAADACGLSQPALSARIRKLETDLDIPIVTRGNRFQGFTPEGEVALKWARRLLADRAGLLQEVADAHQTVSGTLTLGVIPTALPAVAALTAPFADAHPGVSILILSRSSIEIQRGLDGFAIDAGITYLRNEPLTHVRTASLYQERYVLVAAPELVADGLSAITWSDAARLPLCLMTADMQNRRIIDSLFGLAGAAPRPQVVSNSFVAIVGHVRTGRYASVLPVNQARFLGADDLLVLPLTDPDAVHEIGLAIPDREPILPLVKRFWDAVTSRDEPR
ncbi:MAG: LysR family transcriptional regulator [Pseudomonadota bacterium]